MVLLAVCIDYNRTYYYDTHDLSNTVYHQYSIQYPS